MSDASDIPNLGLLIKLLKMTTSTIDGEALAAMRKANEQLAKFGGDWEALLRGRVTVIGDPFAGLDDVPRRAPAPPPPPPARPKAPPPTTFAQAAQPFVYTPKPKPAAQPKPTTLSFTRDPASKQWCVRSSRALPYGSLHDVVKRNGDVRQVKIINLVNQNNFGDYLYAFDNVTHPLKDLL